MIWDALGLFVCVFGLVRAFRKGSVFPWPMLFGFGIGLFLSRLLMGLIG
jgi:hypothetical protein